MTFFATLWGLGKRQPAAESSGPEATSPDRRPHTSKCQKRPAAIGDNVSFKHLAAQLHLDAVLHRGVHLPRASQ
jgi:hypothetical protein